MMSETRQTFEKNFHSIVPLPVQIVAILTVFLLVGVSGDSNWMQECDICSCNWNSGKKTADCKNKSLTQIPTGMSSELQVIDLSWNIIPEIRKDEFFDAHLQNLHKLYIKNCTLQEVNRDSFRGLPLLIELDLSNNFISVLHAGTFSGLVKLRNLVMNNNEIEVLENHLFENLEYLHRIEFKHNRIKKIGVNTFVNVPFLMIIYLEGNNLTFLRKETFENIPKLIDLSLAQNPWNCTCELQPFRNFTLSRNLYTPPTDCQSPAHLQGKLWSDIPMEEFACRPKIIHPGSGTKYPTLNMGTSRTGIKLEATGENFTLTCRVQGSPMPDVFWVYNKRPLNSNDNRMQIRNFIEFNRRDSSSMYVSNLTIWGVRGSDKGTYTCVAENKGGKDEADIQLAVNVRGLEKGGIEEESDSNLLLIICIAIITLLLVLIFAVLVLCYYCRRIRKYTKDSSENGLISTKIDKSQNGSILEGSVIIEMQKSLLTEVNPVEKPPRRTDIEAVDTDDGHEIKRTLLDEMQLGNLDEETNSIALSDTTPRSRQTFVDDGYGTNLPPDLIAFPARVPHSSSLQSSISNIPDNRIYRKSPLSSPVYQHITQGAIYGTTPTGFRTLQHPKTRNLALTNNCSNSPFVPAPIIYPPVVMKQGYMTIPRKPRVPSWTPSVNTTLTEFQPSSPSTVGTEVSEPVYDNLGLRTTAGGNSVLNINKQVASNQPIKYTMKDRPLPATPNIGAAPPSVTAVNGNYHHSGVTSNTSAAVTGTVTPNATKIYEPIHELANNSAITSDMEPLYGTAKRKQSVIVPNSAGGGIISKIPPRPPPKPKKKIAVTSNGQGGSKSQLFEDEGEDGTEV